MLAADLDLLCKAARSAGQIACGFSSATVKSWEKPDSAGPVTEADLAVNDDLRTTLLGARPDYGWLSEEDEDGQARLSSARVFVVDPIDGTRAFMNGLDSWGHSLAIVKNGEAIAGAVYMPKLDLLFSAARGLGAFCNGVKISASPTTKMADAHVIAAPVAFDAKYWKNGTPNMKRTQRPSLAYRLCLVAQGRFDAILTFRNSWEWDIAAGTIILTEAGAKVTDRLGSDLTFNNLHPQSRGVIAANPNLHSALHAAIDINA